RVDGLVLTTLADIENAAGGGMIPPALRQALALLRRRTLGWDLEQRRVLAWLEKHGVSPVVLKGSALRYEVYAEPAQRPVVDLDILCAPDALAPARTALEALGYHDPNPPAVNAIYAAHHFHTQMVHPGGFAVEIHWALTPPGPQAQIDAAAVLR